MSVGDIVLVRQDKTDKLTTTFNASPHKIISKTGNKVVVQSPTGAQYARNTTFVKKYEGNRLRQDTHTAQEETNRAESIDHSEAAMEGKQLPAAPSLHTETDSHTQTQPDIPVRPQRARRPPSRLSDYVCE